MKIKICDFSGLKIHPGHGIVYVRTDSKSFNFLSSKTMGLQLRKRNPRKVPWTTVYRKLHKKDASSDEGKRRKARKVVKVQRAIVGASLEAIRAKRTAKPQSGAAANAAAKQVKDKKKVQTTKAAKSMKMQALKAQQKPVAVKAMKGADKKGR